MKITTARRAAAALGSGVLAVAFLAGCGSDKAGGAASVPDGWGTLKTPTVDVSYPKGYVAQSAAERSKYNAAAATRTESGITVSTITVQIGFTNADSAEEAAIGAEAGIQLGATLLNTTDVKVAGTDTAKRVEFEFSSTGEDHLPPKGTRIRGVIVTGLDSRKQAFAVRVDAQKGKLDDGDLEKIVKSVEVR
ncbi:hypothetical protein ACFYMW_29425 [Streptomyces sp. NPDC006692]|uniref:hypothetical protein n=1 Tax=unclassified Streptomyces TaxID=2593676 RepID=UPI003690D82C